MRAFHLCFAALVGASPFLQRPDCAIFDRTLGRPTQLCPALAEVISRLELWTWTPMLLRALLWQWARIPHCEQETSRDLRSDARQGNCSQYVAGFCTQVVHFGKMMREDEEALQLLGEILLLIRDEAPMLQDLVPYIFETPVPGRWQAMQLGSPRSLGLAGAKWTGRRFDCRGGVTSFPKAHRTPIQIRRMAGMQGYLSMDEISWVEGTWQSPNRTKLKLPAASVTLSRGICSDLKRLLAADFGAALALRESWASQLAGQPAAASLPAHVGDAAQELYVPLHLGLQRNRYGRLVEVGSNSTQKLILFRLGRLVELARQVAPASRADWEDFISGQMTLTLEALLISQFLLAYNSFQYGTGPILPKAFFYDYLGDRAAVVLSVLGEEAQNPEKLLVEIGVFRGLFALAVLQRSRLKYVGIDDYNPANGYKTEDKDLYTTVRGQIKAMAGDRAELHKITSERSGEVKLPTPTGLADFVFVDGDHSYAGALRDLQLWWPRLKPGGLLMGHDLCSQLHEVAQAVATHCDAVGCDRVNLGMDTVFWIQKPL